MTTGEWALYEGAAGESRVASWVGGMGFALSKPHPDRGIDLLASQWAEQPRYSTRIAALQVKAQDPERPVEVHQDLARFASEGPALAINSPATGDGPPEFRVCAVHDYLLRHRGSKPIGRTFQIPARYFTALNRDGFRQLMLREMERVVGLGPFSTSMSSAFAVTEWEVLVRHRSLQEREMTVAELETLQRLARSANPAGLAHYAAGIRDGSIPADELAEYRERARTAAEQRACRRWIRVFARAVDAFLAEGHFEMPDFKWEPLSTWRVLLGVYPITLELAKVVLESPDRWSDRTEPNKWSAANRAVALHLAGAATCSDDAMLARRAREIIHRYLKRQGLPGRARNRYDYLVQHAFYFALAQLNGEADGRPVEFLYSSEPMQQLLLHRRYYSVTDDAVLARNSVFLIRHPHPRDVPVRHMREVQSEIVDRFGTVA